MATKKPAKATLLAAAPEEEEKASLVERVVPYPSLLP